MITTIAHAPESRLGLRPNVFDDDSGLEKSSLVVYFVAVLFVSGDSLLCMTES